MTGTLTAVFLSVLAFVGGHFLLSWPPVRSRIAGALGEPAFSAAYSVLMVLVLVWVVAAYRVAPPLVLWDLGRWVNVIPIVAMPFALMLAVSGLASRNPTAVMGERVLRKGLPVAGIFTITRHPFLTGAALWGLAHLIANGDAASVMLFGGMTVLAIGGMAAIDSKRALKLGPLWQDFVAKTSRLPFAAALQGRTRVDWAGIGVTRPLIGLILYVVLYMLHDRLFGVPVFMG
jgi:uncharacterized membrane protein